MKSFLSKILTLVVLTTLATSSFASDRKDRIKNPNKLKTGQKIIIPVE